MMSSPSTILRLSRSRSRALLSAVSMTALLTFSGCSSLPQLDIRTAPVDAPRPAALPNIPNPKPIETALVEWVVLTPERLPTEDGWVYYGLTPEQYETLARNMAEILRGVRAAQWRLEYSRGEGNLDGAGNQGAGGGHGSGGGAEGGASGGAEVTA